MGLSGPLIHMPQRLEADTDTVLNLNAAQIAHNRLTSIALS